MEKEILALANKIGMAQFTNGLTTVTIVDSPPPPPMSWYHDWYRLHLCPVGLADELCYLGLRHDDLYVNH